MKPFLYVFSFCFIRYEVGLCNPFNIFLLLFYMLRCGYVKPFIYFFSFWFYILPNGLCETLFMYFYFWFYMLHSGYVKPSFMLFLSNISNACITHFVCQKVVSQTTFCIYKF